jgi:aspartate/methionine/tyrosine aminotransferase
MVNGVTAGLEVLGWALADPGDLVIVPTPIYGRWTYRY